MNETPQAKSLDVLVVVSGFSGMYLLHLLRGMGLSVRVIEAGDGVGGTWFWNRYPGARCDVESMSYCYTFDPELQREWQWSERYPSQPEILRYLNHVADRYDLRRDIHLETRVTSAHYDEAAGRWRVATDRGDRFGPAHDDQFLDRLGEFWFFADRHRDVGQRANGNDADLVWLGKDSFDQVIHSMLLERSGFRLR